jgi:hypothetical protein
MRFALCKEQEHSQNWNFYGYGVAESFPAWRKNTYSQTSRLETPEELQLHHNHEKFLFLTVLLLFAQCKMHNW